MPRSGASFWILTISRQAFPPQNKIKFPRSRCQPSSAEKSFASPITTSRHFPKTVTIRRRRMRPTLSPPSATKTMASTPTLPRSGSPHPTSTNGSSPVSFDTEETGISVCPRGHYRSRMSDGVGSSVNFTACLTLPCLTMVVKMV